jgi:DNA-binding PadR family transcriptional regulator
MKRTTTSYLILGLLCSRDWSAYELAEQIGRGVTELWPRADRQLYNAPKRLVEEGLAVVRTEPAAGSRTRTIYSITDAGQAALREWLADRTVAPSSLEFEGMVRVMVADRGTIEDLRADLQTMADQARQSREVFFDHARLMLSPEGGEHPDRLHLFAMVDRFMIGHFDHIASWAEWALGQVADWPDTTSPAVTRTEQAHAALEECLPDADTQRADRADAAGAELP